VLAIGEKARCNCDKPDCDAGLPDVRVGDAVVFHRFDSGDLLRWRGEEFLLVDASKIKAKLE
jgi:co-chaperonin GroES (HSP10)